MNTGSNTKNQPNATKNTIDTSESETEKNAARSTIPENTLSQKNSFENGSSSASASPISPSKISEPLSDLALIDPQDLPSEILGAIGAALGIAHFAIWIPNSLASVVTISSIVELPPGSVIALVFSDTHSGDLPPDHETGKPRLIPS